MQIQDKPAKRQLRVYYLTLIICCLPAGILVLVKGYEESFLWLNSFCHPILDRLMPHFTHIGEGAWLTALFAITFRKKQPALVAVLALAMLLVLALVSPLKHTVFEFWARPLAYFKKETIHYVGLRDWYAYAFPSGHSAAAVCMFAFFAIAWQKQKGAIAMALVAVLAAYSRVYIGVHFVGDILFGAAIGIFISAVSYLVFYKRFERYFDQMSAKATHRWQVLFLLGALVTLAISLYELIRTYYI